jgi:hypothetical protein
LEQPQSAHLGGTPPAPKRRPAKRDLSMVALAVAVVAVTSALIVGAPSAMLGSSVAINPGAAIVGATSVAPAFLKPAAQH